MKTNTLAELYLRQGLVDKALEVYRSMLRVDPRNERVRRRLQELGAGPAAGPGPPAAAPRGTTPAAAAPLPAPGSAHGGGRDRIVRLERWLGLIRGAGAPGPGAS